MQKQGDGVLSSWLCAHRVPAHTSYFLTTDCPPPPLGPLTHGLTGGFLAFRGRCGVVFFFPGPSFICTYQPPFSSHIKVSSRATLRTIGDRGAVVPVTLPARFGGSACQFSPFVKGALVC